MKRTRTKGNGFMKVTAVCVLSIGLFSLAMLGFNRLVFAQATGGVTPLPIAATTEISALDQEQLEATPTEVFTPEQVQLEIEEDTFIAPTFTLIEILDSRAYSVPSSAIAMEDAAQIGARYIWDVFGTDIDGLYMEIWFSAHASQINTTWTGLVYMENPLDGTLNEVYEYLILENSASPVYMFSIDSITGERINISYMCQPDMNARRADGYSSQSGHTISGIGRDVDDVMASRTALLNTGWFDMSIDEQVVFAGISVDALESYLQIATRFAESHFNTSDVSDVQLHNIATNGMIDDVVEVAALNFTAVNNTGREALIFIPATGADFGMTSIDTSHNDFVPGFNYNHSGGIG